MHPDLMPSEANPSEDGGTEPQLDVLAELMQAGLFLEGGEDEGFRAVTAGTARAVCVERVGIWRFTPDRDAIVCAALFERSTEDHSAGQVLERETYPSYFRAMAESRVIPAHYAREDMRTREFRDSYLLPLGITSMLDAPILVEGRLEGVLCLEHVGPARRWSHGEQMFAVSIANLVSLMILERARAMSEARFRLVARATHDAIWEWDLVTDELQWYEGLEGLFGYDPAELEPGLESWTRRIHPEDRDAVVEGLERSIEAGEEAWSAEYRFRRKDGRHAYVLDRGHVIRDASGKGIRMIGGMTDLTERRELELQLLQSQKMESIGRLAGGIAHDFNNLLTVVLGTTDLGLARLDPEDELWSDMEEIRRAAERASALTNQLLAFSRKQILNPRLLDVNGLVEQLLRLLRRLIGESIEVRFHPGDDVGSVRADPGRLEQVLVNLAINARDAMPEGGILTIETANVPGEDPEREASGPGTPSGEAAGARPAGVDGCGESDRKVRIRIRDSGVGMDGETLGRIFEPFFTTKPQGRGTGLGLATAYGIVEQSGGTLTAESRVGEGSVFTIVLPHAGPGQEPEETPVPASAPARTGTETVLVVEDEAPLRRLVERVLSRAGYSVTVAADGREAMGLLESRNGEGTADAPGEAGFELLLTDVVMPGMSGPELARRVVERHPDTRVLYISGYDPDALTEAKVRGRVPRLLEKPFTIEDLLHGVREVLDGG